jgi:hypothetical protein
MTVPVFFCSGISASGLAEMAKNRRDGSSVPYLKRAGRKGGLIEVQTG